MSEPTLYDAIISLGAACAPAGNIRLYFGTDKAFPFDWWISTREGIENTLRADFQGLFQRENMEVIPAPHNSIGDRKFKVMYHHDFRDAADKEIADDWEDRIPKRLERFQALAARMNAICSTGHVLFVRQEITTYRGWDFSPEAAAERAKAWLSLFREKWPNGRADLLTLDSGPEIHAPLDLPTGRAMFDNTDGIDGDTFWRNRGFARVFKRWDIRASFPRSPNKRYSFRADEAALHA